MQMTINIVGGGLAGCECAHFLARNGFKVNLYEMKPKKFSPAHHNLKMAEIVCSNSLKNEDVTSSSGLLKAEMEKIGSIILATAKNHRVPAGNALAVDRDAFSEAVDQLIRENKNITVINEEVVSIPNDGDIWVIATGPLTSEPLSLWLKNYLGDNGLYFFDASAPIVLKESLDQDKCYRQDRYGVLGEGDYINCPMTKDEYLEFYNNLISAECVELKEFEKKEVFEGCMPIEIMAKRGEDALRYGPLKPVGLGKFLPQMPYAVLQLRKENVQEDCYNLVGFQTNLKFSEQKRVFSLIPALKNAEFIKYGVMHRNSYINSPKHLNKDLSLKRNPNIFIAGQLSGVEGYVESTASGLLVGVSILFRARGNNLKLSSKTMLGAIINYITDEKNQTNFQPMNSNYGIIEPLAEKIRDKKESRQAIYNRSMQEINQLIKEF